jgi:osmoprotectant transport system substrate-binding protein
MRVEYESVTASLHGRPDHSTEDLMRKSWKVAAGLLVVVAAVVVLFVSWPRHSADTTESTTTKQVKKGPVRVGSKPDGESLLLAQVIMQTLEAHGFTVEDKTNTGETAVVRKALLSKEIDVYPEYTGTAVLDFHAKTPPAASVLQSAPLLFEDAKAKDAEVGLTWLWEAPASSATAIVVSKKLATAKKLVTLEDLAKYIKSGGAFKLAGSRDSFTKGTGLLAFEKTYGFKLAAGQEVQLDTDDSAMAVTAASQGTQGANAAMASGTDGTVSALGMVVLTDSKGAQPAQEPAPVFRTETYQKYREVKVWLSPVFARLDLATMQDLNKQVVVEDKDPKVVAKAWLKLKGFVN